MGLLLLLIEGLCVGLEFLCEAVLCLDGVVPSFLHDIDLLLGDDFSGFFEKGFDVDCEFDGVCSRSTPQVVHASFQSLFPGIEMH